MLLKARWLLLLAACSLTACGDDSGSTPGLGGRCLSDMEICQFTKGVSTGKEIQSKLGNAQQYLGSESAVYVCQQISGQQIVHNDLVTFSFDDSGRLEDILVLRQGSGATPPPTCAQ
jgi:hypothetical protein